MTDKQIENELNLLIGHDILTKGISRGKLIRWNPFYYPNGLFYELTCDHFIKDFSQTEIEDIINENNGIRLVDKRTTLVEEINLLVNKDVRISINGHIETTTLWSAYKYGQQTIELNIDRNRLSKNNGVSTLYYSIEEAEEFLNLNRNNHNNPTNTSCQHEWVWYYGFNDSFEYCKKCNVKK